MNTITPASRVPSTGGAQLRLAQTRAQIAHWLEKDSEVPAASSDLGGALRNALPLLGVLAQACLKSGPPPPARDSTLGLLDSAIALARRHPRTTLLAAGITGLALWWQIRPAARPPLR